MARLVNWFVILVMTIYLPLVLIPGTVLWYKPGVVSFTNTVEGVPPNIAFYRVIKRDSLIEYAVVVRDSNGQIVCESRGGPFRYKKQEGALVDKTLKDWAPQDERCWSLPTGDYQVETTWRIVRPLGDFLPKGVIEEAFGGIIPPKYITRLSPVFHVAPQSTRKDHEEKF